MRWLEVEALDILWRIDLVAVLLLALLMLGVFLLISIDWLKIEVRRRAHPRGRYLPACHYCGEPYDGAHWCRDRNRRW